MSRINYNKVGEFHRVFGHPTHTEPQETLYNNQKLVDFRLSLILEELCELDDAVSNEDFVEVVDALCDIMFVTYGMAHVFGLNISNNVYKTGNSKLTKKVNYVELATYVNHIAAAFNVLKKECSVEYSVDRNNNSGDTIEKQLNLIIELCYMTSVFINVNINKCFEEVSRSNMSKVCVDEQTAMKTVEWYKQNEKKYTDPKYRISDNGNGSKYWVVYDGATSKILKSIDFKLPKFDFEKN